MSRLKCYKYQLVIVAVLLFVELSYTQGKLTLHDF